MLQFSYGIALSVVVAIGLAMAHTLTIGPNESAFGGYLPLFYLGLFSPIFAFFLGRVTKD